MNRREVGMTPEQKARKAQYLAAYRAANAEKIVEAGQAYRAANAEKIAERKKAYNSANAEKIAERKKAYNSANAEKIAERTKAYSAKHKEKKKDNGVARREAMSDSYVSGRLHMPVASVPPELIELKRALLLGHRIQRSLKKEIENEPHRPNER